MKNKITLRAFILGIIFSGFFAVITVYFENRKMLIATATQIAVPPYMLLLLTVLLINPVCRLIRVVRCFSVAEILIIFIMGTVSSGIATFGMASQLIPVMGSLFNQHWNTDQTEWNRYVVPYMEEAFFLSEPGIREAGCEYQVSCLALEQARDVYQAALDYKRKKDAAERAKRELEKALASDGGEPERRIKKTQAEHALNMARQAESEALAEWEKLSRSGKVPSLAGVLETYPGRIREYEKASKEKKEALQLLERKAFEKVETFRRGLPEGKRAFPGFIPLPGENFEIFSGRFRRLARGLRALSYLGEADEKLDALQGSQEPARARGTREEVLQEVCEFLQKAIETLKAVSSTDKLLARQREAGEEWDLIRREALQKQAEIKELRTQRRLAPAEAFSRLDNRIEGLADEIAELEEQKADLQKAGEHLRLQVDAANKVQKVVGRMTGLLATVRSDPEGAFRDPASVRSEIEKIKGEFSSFDGTLRAFLIGDVPWWQWLKPLARWAVLIGLTYVILMTFNVLIFRQWAHNERLIYPLAKLPELVAGAEGPGGASGVPPVFKSGLFWIGVSISSAVLIWNLLANFIPGIVGIDLAFWWKEYIEHSPLQGLLPSARSAIFFTMIGLSFLIPAEISFSLWFFYVLYMVQLLVLVWLGYGANENSFPTEWWSTLNFRSAEGGGALMVFAFVILYKCRKYIFCFFSPSSIRELPRGERAELRISSLLFICCSLALILSLWLGMGASLYYTVFCYLIIMVITIGLVRAVTEGGILAFQAWVSPFHFIRTLFGMNKSWTSPSLFSPLMVYYTIMFLDIKTFIAPAFANSIKIRDDLKMSRGRFHLAVFASIAIAAVMAVCVHLMLAYSKGADAMHPWFYVNFPKDMFNQITSMMKTSPVDAEGGVYWLISGAGLMGALLYLRRFLFWLPHPIGLIMLVSPLMGAYWFSIFLGWLAKSLVSKYGNKETYDKARYLFIGLIIGEIFMVALTMVISVATGKSIGIDLNR